MLRLCFFSFPGYCHFGVWAGWWPWLPAYADRERRENCCSYCSGASAGPVKCRRPRPLAWSDSILLEVPIIIINNLGATDLTHGDRALRSGDFETPTACTYDCYWSPPSTQHRTIHLDSLKAPIIGDGEMPTERSSSYYYSSCVRSSIGASGDRSLHWPSGIDTKQQRTN